MLQFRAEQETTCAPLPSLRWPGSGIRASRVVRPGSRPSPPAVIAALALSLLAASVIELEAQQSPRYENVISANPFGLLLEIFNAEYERALGPSTTAGVGGSFISRDEEDYINADVFWRYYPGGAVFDGWAFGAKAGLTNIPDRGTFFGFGFDVNRSWLLGANDNFYVGLGFGLKRLLGTGDADLELEVIPTIRIVNVGFAF